MRTQLAPVTENLVSTLPLLPSTDASPSSSELFDDDKKLDTSRKASVHKDLAPDEYNSAVTGRPWRIHCFSFSSSLPIAGALYASTIILISTVLVVVATNKNSYPLLLVASVITGFGSSAIDGLMRFVYGLDVGFGRVHSLVGSLSALPIMKGTSSYAWTLWRTTAEAVLASNLHNVHLDNQEEVEGCWWIHTYDCTESGASLTLLFPSITIRLTPGLDGFFDRFGHPDRIDHNAVFPFCIAIEGSNVLLRLSYNLFIKRYLKVVLRSNAKQLRTMEEGLSEERTRGLRVPVRSEALVALDVVVAKTMTA
ncbi:hypothetical protein JCM10295v2_003730 [Rhodotorula toruloides]